MKFFNDITEIEEVKKLYKDLAKKHHPDKGGCTELMKEINAEYDTVLTQIFQRQGKSISEIEELLSKDAVMREKMNQILSIDGIEIEICGKWIWVTGQTLLAKNTLKQCGFFWANKKKAWYWRSEENKSSNKKSISLEQIRLNYGSHSLKTEKKIAIA